MPFGRFLAFCFYSLGVRITTLMSMDLVYVDEQRVTRPKAITRRHSQQ